MTAADAETIESALDLLALARGYRQPQVLITCIELGVFEALAEGGRTGEDLAAALDANPSALRRLLNAAVGLGLLEQSDGVFTNSPATACCLARDGDGYLGHLLRRENAFFTRWSYLSDAVRTGRRPEASRALEDAGDWVRGFEYALYDLARLYGPAVAEALDLDPLRPWRLLDVGGGHGGYSVALARHAPRLQAVVFDLPPVVEVAREIIGTTEVADRVHPQAGDFLHDDLGSGYDIALLFGVLVSEPQERRLALLRRVHEALAPGGMIVLREIVLDNDRLGPLDSLLFDLQMLLSTEAGEALTFEMLATDVREAGFGPLEVQPLPLPQSRPLWLARRL